MTERDIANECFYYFGCIGGSGHYMFHASGSPRLSYFQQPWQKLDGGLQPTGQQVQGPALLHHKDGWTALCFWDRSVDGRPGSNSNFLSTGNHTFEEMIELAKKYFPMVMARFNFSIVLHPGDQK